MAAHSVPRHLPQLILASCRTAASWRTQARIVASSYPAVGILESVQRQAEIK
jgi:hypothetical protein